MSPDMIIDLYHSGMDAVVNFVHSIPFLAPQQTGSVDDFACGWRAGLDAGAQNQGGDAYAAMHQAIDLAAARCQ